MRSQSRTVNIARNTFISLICQIITIILGFVSRKAIIVSLGLAYNGVNSLFAGVINVLSFVELGIGNAIVYKLYKPLAEGDELRVASFIGLYEKVYAAISTVVLVLGCSMIPFLGFFVTVEDGIRENAILMYVLTIASTSCTYIFAAKKSLLIADQKQYIERLIYQITHIGQVVFQIIVLFVFKNYYLFLILQIIFNLLNNILTACFANRVYPFLLKKTSKVSFETIKDLFADVKATMFYKIGTSCLNYIDTLFISYFCGLVTLGKVTNYTLILSTLAGLISQFTNAMSASIGNKNVTDMKENLEKSFFDSLFLVVWVSGYFFVAFLCLGTPFIIFVFGKECEIELSIIACIALVYLTTEIHSVSATYRYAIGVFRQGRFAPLIASFLNIGLSYVLFKLIGIPGLYIATVIARISTMGIVDAYYILGGKKGVIKYFTTIAIYEGVMSIFTLVAVWISRNVLIQSLFTWLIFAILLTVIYNVLWFIVFYRSPSCKRSFAYIKSAIRIIKKY